jgi:hypothetical protein
MTPHRQTIRFLRQRIPSFECIPGCHDCCGPVTTSPEEMSRLPRKTAAEHEAGLSGTPADLPPVWHHARTALPTRPPPRFDDCPRNRTANSSLYGEHAAGIGLMGIFM